MKHDVAWVHESTINYFGVTWWNPLTWFNRDVWRIDMKVHSKTNLTEISIYSCKGPMEYQFHSSGLVLIDMLPNELNEMAKWVAENGKNGFFIVDFLFDGSRRMIEPKSNEERFLKMGNMAWMSC